MKRGNNGGYANAWLLGDIDTNEIARLELGLKHVALEKKGRLLHRLQCCRRS